MAFRFPRYEIVALEIVTRQLSDRERTVLLLAADGLTDKQIANHLQLSQRTIGTYWERMRQKMGQYSRTQLVANFVRSTAEAGESTNYRNLFSSWQEGVWVLLPSGETLYANHKIAELFGMTPQEFERKNARGLIESAASIKLEDLFAAASHREKVIEFRVVKPNGEILWLSMVSIVVANGQSNRNAIVLRLSDITVQRRVKETLSACEASVSFLSAHCQEFVARFDAELNCTFANPALIQFLGRDIKDSRMVDLGEVLTPADLWIDSLHSTLKTGESQSFNGGIAGDGSRPKTHLLPLPSEDNVVRSLMSVTTR